MHPFCRSVTAAALLAAVLSSAFGAGMLSASGARAQVPPVTGTCVANCDDGNGRHSEPDRPSHEPGPARPSPAELERQAFEQTRRDYQAVLGRLNYFISYVRASSVFDPAVRESVLTIFGEDRDAIAARGGVVPDTRFSAPNLLGNNYQALEADVRGVLARYPGLGSASLYRSAIPQVTSATASLEDRLRDQQSLRRELQEWYAGHPGLESDAGYRRLVDDRAAQIERLETGNAKLFRQARALYQGAATVEADVLARLQLPSPDASSERLESSADRYADLVAPLPPAVATLQASLGSAFKSGPENMPRWRELGPKMATWYPHYAEHTRGTDDGGVGVPLLFARIAAAPQTPGPADVHVAPVSEDRARAQIEPEIRALSQDVESLSDAVGAFNEKQRRYAAVLENYTAQTGTLVDMATPAFRAMHVEALNALVDVRKHDYARSLYLDLYATVRSVAWENVARQLSKIAPATEPRQEAMKRAVKLVPAVHDLANDELAEIMKGPEVIALGDADAAAELESKIDAHVCAFVSANTWPMQNLPAFLRPYLTKGPCSAP
jgi:hypothetical protein